MTIRMLVVVTAAAWIGAAGPQVVTFDPRRAAEMHANLDAVNAVQTAVVRGDLEEARAAAGRLTSLEVPAGLPDVAATHITRIRTAASSASAAADLTSAAVATAEMLGACGTCHRAAGTMPAIGMPELPTIGGTVGHMLEHRRAVDQLLHGLVIPSTTTWLAGARALRTAPLHARELPRDARLTPELLRVEEAIHRLSEEAVGADTTDGRVRVFGTLIARCADCHSLHRRIWGPGAQ